MATLLEIKQATANYLNIAIGDLTQNSQDLFLVAANQVRQMAELANDFEFSRKLVSVTVNGTTGGTLTAALDSDSNSVRVKTVIEVGLLDNGGNLCPVEWTTMAESLTRQREDNMSAWPRYPTDDYSNERPFGGMRFTFSGDRITKWPRISTTDATNYPLYLEAYSFQADWTSNSLLTTGLTISSGGTPNIAGTIYPIGTTSGSTAYAGQGQEAAVFLGFRNSADWILEVATGGYWQRTNASPVGAYNPTAAVGNITLTSASSTSDIWTTYGQKYLLWASIVQLNHLWKRFVPRTEGNLPPPQQLSDEGLAALIAWDAYKYEGFRTHNR